MYKQEQVRSGYFSDQDTGLEQKLIDGFDKLYSYRKLPTNPFQFLCHWFVCELVYEREDSNDGDLDHREMPDTKLLWLQQKFKLCRSSTLSGVCGMPHIMRYISHQGVNFIKQRLLDIIPDQFVRGYQSVDAENETKMQSLCSLYGPLLLFAPSQEQTHLLYHSLQIRCDVFIESGSLEDAKVVIQQFLKEDMNCVVEGSDLVRIEELEVLNDKALAVWKQDVKETLLRSVVHKNCSFRLKGYMLLESSQNEEQLTRIVRICKDYFIHLQVKGSKTGVEHWCSCPFEALYTGVFLDTHSAELYVNLHNIQDKNKTIVSQNQFATINNRLQAYLKQFLQSGDWISFFYYCGVTIHLRYFVDEVKSTEDPLTMAGLIESQKLPLKYITCFNYILGFLNSFGCQSLLCADNLSMVKKILSKQPMEQEYNFQVVQAIKQLADNRLFQIFGGSTCNLIHNGDDKLQTLRSTDIEGLIGVYRMLGGFTIQSRCVREVQRALDAGQLDVRDYPFLEILATDMSLQLGCQCQEQCLYHLSSYSAQLVEEGVVPQTVQMEGGYLHYSVETGLYSFLQRLYADFTVPPFPLFPIFQLFQTVIQKLTLSPKKQNVEVNNLVKGFSAPCYLYETESSENRQVFGCQGSLQVVDAQKLHQFRDDFQFICKANFVKDGAYDVAFIPCVCGSACLWGVVDQLQCYEIEIDTYCIVKGPSSKSGRVVCSNAFNALINHIRQQQQIIFQAFQIGQQTMDLNRLEMTQKLVEGELKKCRVCGEFARINIIAWDSSQKAMLLFQLKYFYKFLKSYNTSAIHKQTQSQAAEHFLTPKWRIFWMEEDAKTWYDCFKREGDPSLGLKSEADCDDEDPFQQFCNVLAFNQFGYNKDVSDQMLGILKNGLFHLYSFMTATKVLYQVAVHSADLAHISSNFKLALSRLIENLHEFLNSTLCSLTLTSVRRIMLCLQNMSQLLNIEKLHIVYFNQYLLEIHDELQTWLTVICVNFQQNKHVLNE